MRRVVIIALLLSLVVGCNREPAFDDRASVVTPEVTSLEVDAGGGIYTIAYDVQNEIEGAPIAAITEAEWITNIDTSVAGSVTFEVMCNDSSAVRQTTLSLRYPSAESNPEITITQGVYGDAMLAITLTNVDYSECTAVVAPYSAEMPYIVMMAEKQYFIDSSITNVEELVSSDENYFFSLMAEDDSLGEFLERSNLARRGETTQRWEGLSPAKEYVIYAYGIAVDGERYRRTTPVYHYIVDSRLPERRDVEFDVAIEGEGVEISITTTPRDWDGYYMVQFVEDTEAGFIPEGNPFTEDSEVALAESFFYVADHLYYFNSLTAEEVMQELGYSGVHTVHKTLNANHTYMVMVYAIASDDGNVPMVVSHPVIDYLTTGSVNSSDMTFDVAITNIRPRSVDIAITPSNDDPYTAVVMYAANLPSGTKAEQLEYIVDHYAPLEMSGYYEEYLDQLPPDTEFVLAIYGFYAGAPTTELFLYTFATAKDGAGGNEITEVRCTAYDLGEVVALEPYYSSYLNYADYFLSVEVFTAEPSPTLHFDIFPLSVVEERGLDAIRESLLEYSYTSSPDWALCTYGNEYVVCGLAEDSSGYIGEMYVSQPVSFSYEQTAPAEEFIELYKEYTTY